MLSKMLDFTTIKNHYPPKLQLFPKGILREYLQYLILKTIFSHPLSKKLCFIWGTALRIGYQSSRFSEDLDFDNWWLTEQEFEIITKEVEKMLILEGYEVEIKHVYKWAFHCVIKIPKILFENNLAGMPTEKLTIKIDTTPQGIRYSSEQKILNKFWILSSYTIAPKDILLSMKFCAFFSRVKGRDLFDIVYLLSLWTQPNRDFLQQVLWISSWDHLKKKIKSRLSELNLLQLQKDVAPFLFDPNNQSVALFPQIIEQTEFKNE